MQLLLGKSKFSCPLHLTGLMYVCFKVAKKMNSLVQIGQIEGTYKYMPFSLVLLLQLNLSVSWQNLSLLQNRESQDFLSGEHRKLWKACAKLWILYLVWTCCKTYFNNLSVKHILWFKSMLPWADFWPAHIAANQTNSVTPPAIRLLKRPFLIAWRIL